MPWIGLVVMNTARVAEDSGCPMVDCCEIGSSPDERTPHGELRMFQSLGFSSLPYPPEDDGSAYAEAVAIDVDGEKTIVGSRDSRSGDVVAKLGPGETCAHTTGPGFESRTFWKRQLWSTIVGNDLMITLDRKNKKIQIAGFGGIFELKPDGATLSNGKAAIILTGDTAWIKAPKILIGEKPSSPIAHGATPANLLSPSVLVSMV